MEPVTIIATFSAIMAALGVLQKERDYRRSREAYEEEYARALTAPDIQEDAALVARVLPQSTLDILAKRVQDCWRRYEEQANRPGPIQEADKELILCICTELKRIKILEGSIPGEKMRAWWNLYACGPDI